MGAVTDSSFAGSWLVGSLVGLEINSKVILDKSTYIVLAVLLSNFSMGSLFSLTSFFFGDSGLLVSHLFSLAGAD